MVPTAPIADLKPGSVPGMSNQPQPDVVRISTSGDVVSALIQMLGFVPTNSVGVLCVHGGKRRLGLAMRFGLELAGDPSAFAAAIDARVRHDGADGVFVMVFAEEPPGTDGMPFEELVEPIGRSLRDLLLDVLLVVGDRWWSYVCDDPACCSEQGGVIDRQSPGATSLTAAYAILGQGVLPSREAVVASVAYSGEPGDATAMCELIDAALDRLAGRSRSARRVDVRSLLSRLSAASHDPRSEVSDLDAAELAALCEDVVVRDEVLIRARKTRRRVALLRVLTQVVRRVPPPYDAPVCATLAWIAYAGGDGVVANVAIDRALETDPEYSLALLIDDALARQVPPRLLEEVMQGAARDLARIK